MPASPASPPPNPARSQSQDASPDTATGVAAPLDSCPACGCTDLFVRKAFPQKLGLAVVVVAGVAFLVLAANPRTFRFGVYVLLGATLLDAVLYFVVGKTTVCYRCRGEFSGVPVNPEHEAFD